MLRAANLLRNLFRKRKVEHELKDELSSYLALLTRRNIQNGMSEEEARRAAVLQFGGVEQVKEQVRESRAGFAFETLLMDLRYAVRSLLNKPGFTLTAVIALALGIGANTAIFSVVNAVLLRPLPFSQPDALVAVKSENGKTSEIFPTVSAADFFDFQSQSRSCVSLAGYAAGWPITLIEADRPEEIPAALVTDDFFQTLGTQPLLGRTFTPEEFRDASRVVILSQRLWQQRFGADPAIIGKNLPVSDGRLTVVGVMPSGFKLPALAQAWTPMAHNNGLRQLRAARIFEMVVRLKQGVTRTTAEAELRTIAARLAQHYPDSDANWSVRLTSLRESLVGSVRPALLVLFGAVGLVLLIACGNVANLLLARAATRRREMAIRSALGASRWRIIRQLLCETLLLALLGATFGVLLAQWCVGTIIWLVPKDLRFPRIEEAHADPAVLAFTCIVALLVGVILGLVAGFRASRADLDESLNESGRSTTDSRRLRRARGAMMVAEISLTLVLLAGAGLLMKSFLKLQGVELGFNPEHLLVVPVSAAMPKYEEPQARGDYFARMVDEVQRVPGVQSVATASCAPLLYTMFFPFSIEGGTNPNEVPQAWYNAVSPNYFAAMGIQLRAGRSLDEHDRPDTLKVAVINETMHRRYFADTDPIGKKLTVNYLGAPVTFEIVGVSRDIKQESLAAAPNAQIYVSNQQLPWFGTALLVRTFTAPGEVITAVQKAIHAFDPTQSGTNARTMDELLGDSVAQPRFYTLLLGVFAALALVLAAIGIYGVIAYSVTQRTHEIGIRMALGASRGDIMRLVLGNGMLLTTFGVAVGIAASVAVTRLLQSLLFDVAPTDESTFGAVSAMLLLVALVATYLPARRATRVNPTVALRYE